MQTPARPWHTAFFGAFEPLGTGEAINLLLRLQRGRERAFAHTTMSPTAEWPVYAAITTELTEEIVVLSALVSTDLAFLKVDGVDYIE